MRSPADLEAHNPSMAGGDLAAGSAELDQQLVFRPAPELFRYRAPLRGLRVCGAATHPGPGVHGASGGRSGAGRPRGWVARTVLAVTTRELNRATLARQGLLERLDTTPVALAERLVGLQGQEPLPPLIGLWTRLAEAERVGLQALVDQGRLVRASLMRGTLHLVSVADYRRLRPAVQPVLDRALAGHQYTRGLDLDAVEEAAREVFGDRTLTFDEVRDALAPRFPDANPRGLGYAARLRLPLVADPSGGFRVLEAGRAIAPAKLRERYQAAFGPATAADFRTWSGLTGGDRLPEDAGPRPDPDTPAPVRFLPAFDNMLLAHKDRSRVIAPEHAPRVVTKNLRVHPTFLVDGFVAGTWKAKRGGKRATLALEPFGRTAKAVRAELEREGEALLRFLEPDASAFAVT